MKRENKKQETKKKLVLNRLTIRNLTNTELGAVRGGSEITEIIATHENETCGTHGPRPKEE